MNPTAGNSITRARLHCLAILAASISLSGCSMKTKEDLLPQTGPTMKEVYDAHSERAHGQSDPHAALGNRSADERTNLEGYTRDAAREIDARFPRLPNPDLVMYVFPHLSDGNYPVPGYTTLIPLYEKVEYALPGEKEGWQ
jgi:conjugative transfer region lipoprotein (TIGR03751 family)